MPSGQEGGRGIEFLPVRNVFDQVMFLIRRITSSYVCMAAASMAMHASAVISVVGPCLSRSASQTLVVQEQNR